MARRVARGSLLLDCAIGVALLLVIGAMIVAVHGAGKRAGRLEVRAEWDAEKLRAEAAARAQRQELQALAGLHEAAVAAARDQAARSDQRWREALRAGKKSGVQLVSCGPAPAPQQPAGVGVVVVPVEGDDPGDGVFSWGFVGLYDGAWTRGDGQPLFGDPEELARAAGGSAAAASPYGAEELLERHKENAQRFDACRRDLTRLNDFIDQAEAKWQARYGPQ